MLRTTTRIARQPLVVLQGRPSSSAAHSHDDTVYPKEGFGAPIWRKTLLCIVGGTLFYEALGAPLEGDKAWMPSTDDASAESWVDVAARRASREVVLLEQRQFLKTTTRPPIYRRRNPEDFHNVSPFANGVGMHVQWSTPPPFELPLDLPDLSKLGKREK
ncbi:hypothetical protein B0H10DRAFT_2120977 [Mycena sp. CBHHK59/15]|nr:hypothetical protein B0H10DRAFT_2120977 [Mycena sp. CBHHK59/15]